MTEQIQPTAAGRNSNGGLISPMEMEMIQTVGEEAPALSFPGGLSYKPFFEMLLLGEGQRQVS